MWSVEPHLEHRPTRLEQRGIIDVTLDRGGGVHPAIVTLPRPSIVALSRGSGRTVTMGFRRRRCPLPESRTTPASTWPVHAYSAAAEHATQIRCGLVAYPRRPRWKVIR